MTEIPVGSVVDFSNADPTVGSKSPQLEINGTCRIVGRQYSENALNFNTINNHVLVKAGNNNLVEFENLIVRPPGIGSTYVRGGTIECLSGNIAFRYCSFGDCRKAVIVGCGSRGIHVTFESCLFILSHEFAIMVDEGNVTVVNCHFRTVGVGVIVKESARLNLHHCTFLYGCLTCVLVTEGGKATVNDTQFSRIRGSCIQASNGAIVSSERCSINGCPGSAIVIDGSNYTDVTLNSWHVRDCKIGIKICSGKVITNLHNSIFEECSLDIYIAPDVTGIVDITNYEYNPEDIRYLNFSGDKCRVWLNNVLELPGTQVERFRESKRKHKKREIHFDFPTTGVGMRAIVKGGMVRVVCTACSKPAPTGELFPKCARCAQVRYCSKACQTAHWPTHHMKCCVYELRARLRETKGYVPCDQCGNVEAVSEKTQFSACSRCLKVFYCSKNCQKAAWRVHRLSCVEYRKPKSIS